MIGDMRDTCPKFVAADTRRNEEYIQQNRRGAFRAYYP